MTYVIVRTRYFYGPTEARDVLADRHGKPLTFDSRKAAKSHIEELDSETYYLSHNEAGRPAYRVHALDRLPRYLADSIAYAI
jgi:hypothetical protein